MGSRLDGPEDRRNKKNEGKNPGANRPPASLFGKQAKGNNVKKAFKKGYETT